MFPLLPPYFRPGVYPDLVGGNVFTYDSATDLPATTYTSAEATVANTNPVILDSAGFSRVWLLRDTVYKIILTDSTGNIIWEDDHVTAVVGAQGAPGGPDGDQGPKGKVGPIGATGIRGIKGIKGLKGDPGDNGYKVNVWAVPGTYTFTPDPLATSIRVELLNPSGFGGQNVPMYANSIYHFGPSWNKSTISIDAGTTVTVVVGDSTDGLPVSGSGITNATFSSVTYTKGGVLQTLKYNRSGDPAIIACNSRWEIINYNYGGYWALTPIIGYNSTNYYLLSGGPGVGSPYGVGGGAPKTDSTDPTVLPSAGNAEGVASAGEWTQPSGTVTTYPTNFGSNSRGFVIIKSQ